MADMRQPRPDSGLGLQETALETFWALLYPLGSEQLMLPSEGISVFFYSLTRAWVRVSKMGLRGQSLGFLVREKT